eukprot:GHVP01069442.1.p1 GENE.GHVP01069442.1~~GHVP01069442.1.p1  ORF type:complete len:450 (-),score=78.21 GHVP01069442.1:98-1447(-)
MTIIFSKIKFIKGMERIAFELRRASILLLGLGNVQEVFLKAIGPAEGRWWDSESQSVPLGLIRLPRNPRGADEQRLLASTLHSNAKDIQRFTEKYKKRQENFEAESAQMHEDHKNRLAVVRTSSQYDLPAMLRNIPRDNKTPTPMGERLHLIEETRPSVESDSSSMTPTPSLPANFDLDLFGIPDKKLPTLSPQNLKNFLKPEGLRMKTSSETRHKKNAPNDGRPRGISFNKPKIRPESFPSPPRLFPVRPAKSEATRGNVESRVSPAPQLDSRKESPTDIVLDFPPGLGPKEESKRPLTYIKKGSVKRPPPLVNSYPQASEQVKLKPPGLVSGRSVISHTTAAPVQYPTLHQVPSHHFPAHHVPSHYHSPHHPDFLPKGYQMHVSMPSSEAPSRSYGPPRPKMTPMKPNFPVFPHSARPSKKGVTGNQLIEMYKSDEQKPKWLPKNQK